MKHKKRGATNPLEINEHQYCSYRGKRKRKYPTQLDAELSAPARDLEQYICEACGYWHNGKSKPLTKKN